MSVKAIIAKMEAFANKPTGTSRACKAATWAVLGLELAEAFGASIPNYATDLAELEAIQAEACGTT